MSTRKSEKYEIAKIIKAKAIDSYRLRIKIFPKYLKDNLYLLL